MRWVSIYPTEHSFTILSKLGSFIAQQYVSSVEWNIFYSKHVVKNLIKLLNPSCQKKNEIPRVVPGTTHRTSNNLTFAGQADVFNFCISCFSVYCYNIRAVHFYRRYVAKDIVIWCRFFSSPVLFISKVWKGRQLLMKLPLV